MPKRNRAPLNAHSLADLQAELIRRHREQLAECKAAVAAATQRLADAEDDLRRAISLRESNALPLARKSRGTAHGNAARPDTTLREAVLGIIRDSPEPVRTADIKRIAESMGYSVASVSTLIKFHAQKGNIRQARYGWWEPTTRSVQA